MEHEDRLRTALADRYVIEGEIGSGGMATVYLAQDLKHNRQVAVKVLKPELAAVIGAERFLKEIEVTANLQHPHILPLHDSGEADSFLFYVMPYVEGESLRAKLHREKQLPVDEAVKITAGVASALDYAHRRDVIHRDIKPGNILLQDGQALVADFGIALAVSEAGGNRVTETGLSLGTPEYMSPEQATGDRKLDARSDLYSLGTVLYEMLVGEPPHTASTVQGVVAKLLTDRPRPVRQLRETVPVHVEAALEKALARLPADRFESGTEFAEALAGRGFRPLGATDAVKVAEGPKGRDRIDWRIAAMLLAAVGGGVLLGRLVGPSDRVTPAQTGWFTVDAPLGEANYGARLDIARDGSRIVYLGRAPGGESVLIRRELDEPQAVPIAGTEGALIGLPTFSRDGQSLGFSANREFKTVSVQGGAVRTVAPMAANARGVDWGPGELIVFQTGQGEGLSVLSVEGGEARVLTNPDRDGGEIDHRWPHILPDGGSVLFTIWRGTLASAQIAIAPMETGEHRPLISGTSPHYVNAGYLVFATPEGSLRAVEFDPGRGELRGTPITVLDSVVVAGDGAADYALSADGTLAFFSSSPRRTPVFVDRSGGTEPLSVPPGLYMSPRLSPDGTAFAVGLSEADVWIYQSGPGTFAPLTFDGGFYPLWTPDGGSVLFSRDEAADVNIYEVPVDRAREPTPVFQASGQHRTQSLSPDGRHLLIRQTISGRYELWVLDRDTPDQLEPWLETEFLERAPEFSPDGKWISYTSDESGRDEVYVRPFPGPGGRVQISTDGGSESAWSRDGGEFFFRSGDRLLTAQVETGDTFRQLSQPQVLFEGRYFAYGWSRQYDPHPDGNRFLMLQTEAQSTSMTVVMNWFQGELRRIGTR
jgi:serine/threonine-protein kinase